MILCVQSGELQIIPTGYSEYSYKIYIIVLILWHKKLKFEEDK